jgi:hypothetical protein
MSYNARTIARIINILILSTAAVCSTPLLAAGALPFNQWSVSNGTIDASATCNTAGVSCTVLAEDAGMLQQEVTTANGSYIQLIITEANATGTAASLGFVTENFIPTNRLTDYDIHNQQIIRDPAQGFEQIALIERVPFYDASDTLVDLLHVDLQQSLNDQELESRFRIIKDEAVLSNGEVYNGKSIDINQNLVAATDTSASGVKMVFDARSRSGWKLTNNNQALQMDPFAAAGDISLSDATLINTLGSDPVLAWIDGDSISNIWISQYHDELANSAFGIQRTDNLSNKTTFKAVRFDPAAIIDPFAWNEQAFGLAPPLP